LSTSFLLAPRPPAPTPFPYTTLFRSLREAGMNQTDLEGEGACARNETPAPAAQAAARRKHRFASRPTSGATRCRRCRPRAMREEDRKSTRLNSSHVKISYAVFCLKKK